MAGIVNQALGGGLSNGFSLADKLQQRKDRSKLQELADLARGGLGNADIANQLGAGLIGLGQFGAGINAQNVPYQREQQALQRDFQNNQFQALQDHRSFQRNLAERQFDVSQQPKAPAGYLFNDPNNPSAGVSPLPGLPQEQPKPTSPVAKINRDFENGLISQQERDALVANATAPKQGLEITTTSDGTTTTRFGGRGGSKAPTEGQAKANIFSTRAEASNKILAELDGQGTDLQQVLIGNLPLGNFVNTPKFQQYKQAQRDFVNAILRQESGAVINPDEFANAQQQYFPQPGDSAEVIEQKRKNREIAVRTIREASGPFANKSFDDIPTSKGGIQGQAEDNPIVLQNAEQAENLKPGTFVSINGRIAVVE